MDPISLILGVGSLGLSFYAVITAKSAKTAARLALRNRDHQDDLQSLLSLIALLEAAKDGARNWLPGVDAEKQAGQDENDDIEKLRGAIDAIRTAAPLSLSQAFADRLQLGGDALDGYCNEISTREINENKWPGVVREIQSMVGGLRAIERELANDLALS